MTQSIQVRLLFATRLAVGVFTDSLRLASADFLSAGGETHDAITSSHLSHGIDVLPFWPSSGRRASAPRKDISSLQPVTYDHLLGQR